MDPPVNLTNCISSMQKMDERLPAAFALSVTKESENDFIARKGEYSVYNLFRSLFQQVRRSLNAFRIGDLTLVYVATCVAGN